MTRPTHHPAPDAAMRINADFSRRAVSHADAADWSPSPLPGVERRMLDRLSAESGRATSVVRFAPGSAFAEHVHHGGEEFLVLDGVFQDQHGAFPGGSYVRNPPLTCHAPKSDAGCTIFVKLHQFDPADRHQMHLQTDDLAPQPVPGMPGRAVVPLFERPGEKVRLEVWDAGAEITLPADGGIEIFVLEGGFVQAGERFARRSWLRLPARAAVETFAAGPRGARLWVKSGHLAAVAR